ncbi:MAG: hypothetical protein AB1333_02080 [Patescibacteria group bacterium]
MDLIYLGALFLGLILFYFVWYIFFSKKQKDTEKYYTREDYEAIENAESFTDLTEIAFRIIKRMPQPVSMVCGPIATGGKGNIEENLKVFKKTIQTLVNNGENIFSQIPFEDAMQRIKQNPQYQGAMQLLGEFYLPIFKSGFIKKMNFIKGWEGSFGATWEHSIAAALGIEIFYL